MGSKSNSRNLDSTIAVVTGASRGLGRAYVKALAQAGATVVCVARSRANLERTVCEASAAGGVAIACVADVSDANAADDILSCAERAFGTPDLLVNNAGILGPLGPFDQSDAGEWWRCMEANLAGPMRMMNALLPRMLARNHGRIINITSGAGTSATPYLSAYATSKAALIRLTETIGAELSGTAVRVFAIDPGTVRTKMTEYVLDSPEGKRWLGWFRGYIDEHECPLDRAADFILTLARGAGDQLSGGFVSLDTLQKLARSQA
jgi:NAD(P)-dependent dehydrogenase (short-subunit alcohol dehydrogenase family)